MSLASLTNVLLFSVTLVLLLTCLFGDWLGQSQLLQDKGWARALVDSGTHGSVGAISWLIVLIGSKLWEDDNKRIYLVCEVLLCGMAASFIDIDHFIAAGSFSIKVSCTKWISYPFSLNLIDGFGRNRVRS